MEKYIYKIEYFFNQYSFYSIEDNLLIIAGFLILLILAYLSYKLLIIVLYICSNILEAILILLNYAYQYITHNVKVVTLIAFFVLFTYTLYSYISKHDKYFKVYDISDINIHKLMHNVKKEYKQAKYEDLILIYEEGIKRDVDVTFLYSLVATESAFRANQVSSSNAYGLFQIKLATAKETAQKMFSNHERVTKSMLLYNHEKNIKLGVAYVKLLEKNHLKHIKDKQKQQLILSYAYNGGIGRILKSFSSNTYEAQMYINNMSLEEIIIHLIYTLSLQDRYETIDYPRKIYQHMHMFSQHTKTESLEIDIQYHVESYVKFTVDEIRYLYKSIRMLL